MLAKTIAVFDRYFTPEESEKLGQFVLLNEDETELEIEKIKFQVSPEGLVLTHFPDEEYGFSPDQGRGSEFSTWEAIAFIKVRIINHGEDIVQKARTGELYDESYYTLRGGGSPYLNYPLNVHGYSEEDKFISQADELLNKYGKVKILDCGCATGILVNQLQQRGFDAYGFDISEFAISKGICKNLFHADGRKLPFEDNQFNILISQDFMEHIHPDDLPAVLSEQKRVLAPGGVALHFIPFYKDFAQPVQIDAHLCNANKAWWVEYFTSSGILELDYAPDEDNQWDYADGILSKYFILRK